MEFSEIIGIIGAALVLVAFFLTNFRNVDEKTKADEICNLLGSLCLIYYAWVGGAWPFFVLNTVWALWSFKILLSKSK